MHIQDIKITAKTSTKDTMTWNVQLDSSPTATGGETIVGNLSQVGDKDSRHPHTDTHIPTCAQFGAVSLHVSRDFSKKKKKKCVVNPEMFWMEPDTQSVRLLQLLQHNFKPEC